MFFKTYQKLLGASCLALCLVGCGSDSSKPLVEVEKNSFNSTVKIISKADNIEIQDLKLNRGNCEHDENFLVKLIQERANARRYAPQFTPTSKLSHPLSRPIEKPNNMTEGERNLWQKKKKRLKTTKQKSQDFKKI